MTEVEDIGTALERRQRRRFWSLMGGGFVLALVIGLAGRSLADAGGAFAPEAALLLAGALIVLLLASNWIYFRTADELEWANNLNGCFWGFNAFMIGWPVWFILWKGRLVPEPDMTMLYLGTACVALAAYLWKRFF